MPIKVKSKKRRRRAKVISDGILRVGYKPNGSKYAATYNDVAVDAEGWADASKYLPLEFDLVYARVESSLGQRVIKLWYGLGHWDGVRLKEDQKIIQWKRIAYGDQ